MMFTRLRILGFKSFVDPIEFHIKDGQTGIVGPNGCGKSNLVEALRWVMGESSYKNMRASGMDDVIFSGSLNRPSRNTAEVTLFVDNADRTAPAAFNDSDVLEVTRRIEREAGSVYKINGKDVRARDVQLLFADASTGSRSPALVRQGQIGELISAKPTSRRAILEEAAGISGLYSRRHEAELRLRAAETNLDRLDDVLTQIQAQLDGLKRQSRQASRYKNLSGEIRKAEATLLYLQWIAARNAVEAAGEALKSVTLEMATRTKIQAETARDEAVLREQLPKLLDAEARASAVLQTLIVARDALEADEARSKSRQTELAGRIEQLQQDLDREQQLTKDNDDNLAKLAAEDAELKDDGDHQSDQVAGLKTDLQAREKTLQVLEQELAELNRVQAATAAERTQLQRVIAGAERALSQNTTQKHSVARELEAIELQLGTDAVLTDLQSAVSDRLRDVADMEAALEQAETALRALRQQDADARKPLRQAEQDLRALQTEAKTLARILQLDEADLWPPLVDALTVAPGLETALGAALGDDIDVPFDANAPTHWRALEPAGPVSGDAALPENSIPLLQHIKGPDLLARRLSQIGLVDKADGAELQKLLKPGQRLVSREGDLWRWDGFVMASEAPSAAALRLENRNRLAELESGAEDTERAVQRLNTDWQEVVTALRHAEETDQALRQKLKQLRLAQARAQEDLAQAEQQRSRITNRKAALEEALKRLESTLAETQTQLHEAGTQLQALPADNSDEEQVGRLRVKIAEARSAAAEARAALQGQEREAARRTQRLQAIANERTNWQRRMAEAGQQIDRLQSRLGEHVREKTVLDEAPDTFLHRRQSLLSQIAKAETDRASTSDARSVGDSELRKSDHLAKQALAALNTARETQVRAEERTESAKQRLADIEARIDDVIECKPSQLHDKTGLVAEARLPDVDSIDKRLDRLKAERERLGGVNLRAEEEAGEVSAQLEGLIAERDDLIEAIRRLRLGIQSLNREGRERLLAAFEVVNGHFQHLFSHLFGGGQAELKLTESDDPLEAGLEIIARPPGKKPQTMTLLSGGEQALTAMSLIFAVFLTNPAPICVLDEVDAPLDDANVERFCSLVDEMNRQTDTRFVIVTHNPITMARMDRLFGVTMAERGVSQLVSVDLQTAEEYLEAS
uniref:chromosome segregation protein SMC n=1 Tax=Pararhizobium sp. IMCC3301 TaxID=3067904 RepID=UPI00274294CB|nr:chromosome segregation protein SMC [Pararhizobium sp. IMCC3301]